jgi:hypothetical protein
MAFGIPGDRRRHAVPGRVDRPRQQLVEEGSAALRKATNSRRRDQPPEEESIQGKITREKPEKTREREQPAAGTGATTGHRPAFAFPAATCLSVSACCLSGPSAPCCRTGRRGGDIGHSHRFPELFRDLSTIPAPPRNYSKRLILESAVRQ